MKAATTAKLSDIISEQSKTPTEEMLQRDMFAVACYLHQAGKTRAARKLLSTLFDHLGRNRRQTYMGDLIAQLEGNETQFALDISAHCEINELFRQIPEG